jgi:hypothetical protein
MSLEGEQAFGECSPEIAAMRIEVVETRLPFGAGKALRVFTMKNHPGEHIACSAYLCCSGGFQIGEMLDHMVRQRTARLSALVACQGYRGSPKGRRRYGPCSNQFSVSISLSFAER